MSTLMARIENRAAALRIPLSAHLDLTWRCNESCIHCYLEHASPNELTTAEVADLLEQLADAGTLFLCVSGGEVFLRRDILEIVARARSLLFGVTVKTNGTLLGEREADALAELAVDQVNISIYSHIPEVHEAITRMPGSFERSIAAVRRLVRRNVKTRLSHILMRPNIGNYRQVQALAAELGAEARLDPTVTPAISGDTSPSDLRVPIAELRRTVHDAAVIPNVDEFCALPRPADDEALSESPCAAGIRSCYISPAGEVMPCVTYPVVCGSIRAAKFIDIWENSEEFRRIREIRKRHLPVCSVCANITSCTRCPGLAHMAGDALGPSLLDCEKTYARTGVPTPLVPVPA